MTFIESLEEEAVNPVTLTHMLARTRTAEIARAAERAALFAPAPGSADRPSRAGLSRWRARVTRPATAASPGCPVPCCA